MLVYSRNVALLSLLISLITATLVLLAINRIMIRPVRDMTRSMLAFSEAPDDPSRIIRPEDRGDEIGVAERELAGMQTRLQKTLAEQKHLADLGLAVSKINHDMRNILASAQLMSDRLRVVKDPSVQSFAPKLVRTLDRAVSYTEGVLAYGRTQEAPPSRRRLRLRQLVEEVHGLLGIDPRWRHRVRAMRSTRASRSTPIPISCSGCLPISAATRCRRWPPTASRAVVRRLDGLGRAHGQRQPHPASPTPAPACRRRRAKTSSLPFAARRAAAAPGSAWPSPMNWCARMAARWNSSKASAVAPSLRCHPRSAGAARRGAFGDAASGLSGRGMYFAASPGRSSATAPGKRNSDDARSAAAVVGCGRFAGRSVCRWQKFSLWRLAFRTATR